MAKPSSQGGHGQSHDEGRQELGQMVQVLLPVPPAGDEGKGPQRGVRGTEEAASEEKWFDCSCVGLFFLFICFIFIKHWAWFISSSTYFLHLGPDTHNLLDQVHLTPGYGIRYMEEGGWKQETHFINTEYSLIDMFFPL